MKLTTLVKGTGLATVAAMLALASVPAQARDHGRRGVQSDSNSSSGSFSRQSTQRTTQPQARNTYRAPQQQQAQVRQTFRGPQQQARVQQTFRGPQQQQQLPSHARVAQANRQSGNSRSWDNGGSQRDYSGYAWGQQQGSNHRDRDSDRQQSDSRDHRDYAYSGNNGDRRGYTSRNYADRNRNTTYVDPRRDSSYSGYRRDNTSRYVHYGDRDGDRNGYRGRVHWNTNWRSDRRYDWRDYRRDNRNIYRLGRYYAPYRDYSYRRIGIGFYLQSLLFGPRYWINDPWYYRLPPVSGDLRWVRYYDDALLVDIYTGEVVDVIHDFFW